MNGWQDRESVQLDEATTFGDQSTWRDRGTGVAFEPLSLTVIWVAGWSTPVVILCTGTAASLGWMARRAMSTRRRDGERLRPRKPFPLSFDSA